MSTPDLSNSAAVACRGAKVKAAEVLILCPQGGEPVAELMAAIGTALPSESDGQAVASIVNLRHADAQLIRSWNGTPEVLQSFEEFRDADRGFDAESEALRLAREYPGVNWWAVAIGERSFTDASFLLGGAGHRAEKRPYVVTLVVTLARFFEAVFSSRRFDAVVCPVADSLITHVCYKVARRFGVRIIGLSPNAWIREDGQPGFFLISDELLHSDRMTASYRAFAGRALSEAERARVQRFKQSIAAFHLPTAFREVTKRSYIVPAVSPNLRTLWSYLRENAARRADIEYFKIDVWAKTRANLLRIWRRTRSKRLLGSRRADIPPHSVFYPMHYQPEQTTLVGGIFFANQIGVIENIAKALPFGYTLVVKEHPRGRGARPVWQYQHLSHFPNVVFCDADSKELIGRCEAVVTITGTVALEAMALDKPVIMLGQYYYDLADIVYRPKSWPDVAQVFRGILIERDYENNAMRGELIDRFFAAYLSARIPAALSKESAAQVARELGVELGLYPGRATQAAP